MQDIYIYTGGTSLNASIEIRVNNKEKVKIGDCSGHSQHYWKTWDGIKVSISDRGAFTTEHRKFYARKAGGGWERKYTKGDSNTFYLSDGLCRFRVRVRHLRGHDLAVQR
ncbi:MAG: hypothetical protein IJT02_03795 [Synergistaceae bacterium]|nr:hypothetical protein [Synergistaceae bacterium]